MTKRKNKKEVNLSNEDKYYYMNAYKKCPDCKGSVRQANLFKQLFVGDPTYECLNCGLKESVHLESDV